MNMITGIPFVMGEGVQEFVKEKDIEEGFKTLCELARDCFAGVLRVEAKLVADPDVNGRFWLAVTTIVPEDYSIDQAMDESNRCTQLRVERIPWSARMHLAHLLRHQVS